MADKSKKPAIRFAGFTDAWEQRKLSEMADIIGGGTPSTSNPEYWDGDIDWYAPAEMEGQRYAVGSVKKITELGLQKSSATILPAGRTVLFTSRAGIGKMAILQRPAATNQGFQSIVIKDNTNPYFIYSMGSEIKKKAESIASGSTFLEISGRMLGNLEIAMPSSQEQAKIACYFEKIDNLITLHQRKYDKLQNVKKSMLEKMFPKNGRNIPEIRFAGFTDAWEQRKLNEVLTSLQNNTLSRADLSSEQGGALNVHYGDVLIRFGEYLDVKKEVLPIISDSSIVGKYKASFLQNGDVIVADTAEDETVGKCSEIAGLTDEIALSGLHTIPYRPMFKFASGFLGYYMNSNSYHSQLLPLMQGIKVTSISKSAMRNTDIYYPKAEDEQAEISTFFRSLDDLITLHQRELEKLKNLKKACLEKMFV